MVKTDTEKPKTPALAVDGIITKGSGILLIKRAHEPYRGHWALPGGFVELGETLEEAVVREIKEETGLVTEPQKLIGAYSDPSRDPRGHTVSIVYLLKILSGKPKTSGETTEIRFFARATLPENLAFDHRKIIEDAKTFIKQ